MKIRTIEYFFREAASSLRHNGLMSIASVTTVALSLLILGMFLILVLNLNNMAAVLESQVQITVYLQDNLNEKQMRDVGTQITKMPGVTMFSGSMPFSSASIFRAGYSNVVRTSFFS